ncbi:hypothetical protein DEE44_12845, partial [Ralstonia pickettii]|uniref:hypothetical protein n=1 Tax=Ralstonia pickettii TaxID=329 RepID=UPI001C719D43
HRRTAPASLDAQRHLAGKTGSPGAYTCAGQILIQALATLRIATPNRAKSGEVADVLIQAFATLEGKS